LNEVPGTRRFMRASLFSGLHLKDRLKVGEREEPCEAPRRVDEDQPVASGCAPAMGGQERTKSPQIDEGQTGTVDQNVTVHVRQLHLELWGGGQVELSGQGNLISWHSDRCG
jgi:hypothetical protein